MTKIGLPPVFGFMMALAALAGLSLTTFVAPGCTGPASPTPCDYVAIFKSASASVGNGRGHSRYFPIEVLDEGSSVYVQQFAPPGPGFFILHTPGVLIDRRSCKVCEVNGYSKLGFDHPRQVLATAPAERPLNAKVGFSGY